MADAITNFEELQKTYGGQFIALQYERVVAHGKTFTGTRAAVERMGLRDVRYQFVHPRKMLGS